MKHKTPNYFKVVVLLTALNLAILALRSWVVGDTQFNYLMSNLFIGSLPVLVIAFLIEKYHERLNPFFFWVATGLWVLFYPNAPYMISDLIHNHDDSWTIMHPDLVKHDTLIIFSIAMLSMFYGLLSLKIMFAVFKKRHGHAFAHLAIFFTIVLSCLGFYIGRELLSDIKIGNGYIYSWEIFFEPIFIIKTTWEHLWPIGEHLPAYAMMALFGVAQYMLLVMVKDINDIEGAGLVTKDRRDGV